MAKKEFYLTTQTPKTLILGIQAPYNKIKNIDSYFEEFMNLVKSNGIEYQESLFIKLRETDSTYFITKGKLEQIQELCDKLEIEEVIISEPLTAQQERNLEDLLRCRVFDRNQLILEIFEKNAHSAEGKAQVLIAFLKHRKSRLAGKGILMSQQSGRIGNRGPGETVKEREARHIEITMHRIKRQLAALHKIRSTQRQTRLDSQTALLCLIGYTNAGKSTVMNALTKSNVLAEDRLFATLDTTTRELYLNKTKIGVLSDTVGFIQNLPHHLVEAFKSTLSELTYADLLLQVIDISDENWESHIKVVHDILENLGVEKEMLYIFNKTDKSLHSQEELEQITQRYQPHIFINATTPAGIAPLIDFLSDWHKNRIVKIAQ